MEKGYEDEVNVVARGVTAEDILHRLHCSVLTVKPSGFVTPVTLEE